MVSDTVTSSTWRQSSVALELLFLVVESSNGAELLGIHTLQIFIVFAKSKQHYTFYKILY
jgi:hypothetical protein